MRKGRRIRGPRSRSAEGGAWGRDTFETASDASGTNEDPTDRQPRGGEWVPTPYVSLTSVDGDAQLKPDTLTL